MEDVVSEPEDLDEFPPGFIDLFLSKIILDGFEQTALISDNCLQMEEDLLSKQVPVCFLDVPRETRQKREDNNDAEILSKINCSFESPNETLYNLVFDLLLLAVFGDIGDKELILYIYELLSSFDES